MTSSPGPPTAAAPSEGRPASGASAVAQTDAVARLAVALYLRGHRRPPGLEAEDVLVIARAAAWSAHLAHKPERGPWQPWVLQQSIRALQETGRTRGYGAPTRSGRQLVLVPLHDGGEALADTVADPRDGYAAADARLLVAGLRGKVRASWWAALEAVYLQDQQQVEYAAEIGRSESRVFQLVREGKRAARELLEAR